MSILNIDPITWNPYRQGFSQAFSQRCHSLTPRSSSHSRPPILVPPFHTSPQGPSEAHVGRKIYILGWMRPDSIARYQANPAAWLGPGYTGVAIDALFLGILCCQASSYYARFPTDSTWNKGLVGVCFILSVLKTLEVVTTTWGATVSGFGDWQGAATISWPFPLDPLVVAALTTTAQTYFAWRCFLLTGRSWLLLAFLGILMLTIVALGAGLMLQLACNFCHRVIFHDLTVATFILSFAVDVTITSIVLYKLAKSRRGSNRTTGAFLTKWMTLTYECALPPALTQMVNTVMFLTMRRRNTWSLLLNVLTPRLYVFSLMYTLNSRLPVRYVPEPETYPEYSSQTITDGAQSTAVTLSTFKATALTSGLETAGNSSMATVNQRSPRAPPVDSSVYSANSPESGLHGCPTCSSVERSPTAAPSIAT